MTKEFIPYEQALALRELGFDEPCLAYWYNETPTNPEGQCLVYYKKPWDNQKIIKGIIRDYYYTPTFSQAFKWFREKYGLDSFVKHLYKSTIKVGYYFAIDEYKGIEFQMDFDDYYKTYEEAELACLNKLIEIIKNKQCSKNGIKKEKESCTLNNNCIYPKCMK